MSIYPSHASATLNESVRAVDAGSTSAVSWAAIFVGASAAAALSLVLTILGFGLGLASVSPWLHSGANASTMGAATIAWIAFTQIAAAAIGGYLAGRLRVKWVNLHTDEVYFRDTAHGFIAWAVASLSTAALLGSALTGIVSGSVHAGATALGGLAVGGVSATEHAPAMASPHTPGGQAEAADQIGMGRLDYIVDTLFRRDAAHAGAPVSPDTRAEALSIFAHDLSDASLTDEDRRYLGGVVAQETGLSPADAEKRVADQFAQTQERLASARDAAKQAIDNARKAAEHASLWMFVALLAGAFFASLAATFGGRRRDRMV
jgi:hypothetical protein